MLMLMLAIIYDTDKLQGIRSGASCRFNRGGADVYKESHSNHQWPFCGSPSRVSPVVKTKMSLLQPSLVVLILKV